jgi:hypothetical protein
MSTYRHIFYTTSLYLTSFIYICLVGLTSPAYAETSESLTPPLTPPLTASLRGQLNQLGFKPSLIVNQAPIHLTLTLDTLDYFNQASTLKELKQAQAEPNLLPAVLSLFTYSSNDTLSHFGSPKVVIRSLSPVKMTFLFTFNFGEV